MQCIKSKHTAAARRPNVRRCRCVKGSQGFILYFCCYITVQNKNSEGNLNLGLHLQNVA